MSCPSEGLRLAVLTTLLTAGGGAQATLPQPTPEMKAVLDQLAALGGKPIETLTPEQARQQPTPADAVRALLDRQRQPTEPERVAKIETLEIPGPAGRIEARIYWPVQELQPMPVVHYLHGGGWVIGDLDRYDASPRAIANAAQAIVVATHYRQAPEHPFPAAHADSLAAYRWIVHHAASLGGDPRRVAVVGESAGGNLAASIALRAGNEGLPAPLHQVLIYPVVDTGMDSASYVQHADARPLNAAMMQWFFRHSLKSAADARNPLLALLRTPLRQNMPPATILTADIDPLRSEGQQFAERLEEAGITVHFHNYEGVTHEFFGMAAAIPQARDAVTLVGSKLRAAFGIPQAASLVPLHLDASA